MDWCARVGGDEFAVLLRDLCFVVGSTENAEDLAVTEAVITVATKMGLKTIAEGVETLDQQRLPELIGADGVHGYLYHRPTGAENLGTWLSGNLDGPKASELAAAATPSLSQRFS